MQAPICIEYKGISCRFVMSLLSLSKAAASLFHVCSSRAKLLQVYIGVAQLERGCRRCVLLLLRLSKAAAVVQESDIE
jgi:hypothetical protein